MLSDIPPLDGLRLLAAALRPGQYLPAEIRGWTVSYNGMCVAQCDEVVVEYFEPNRLAAAEKLKYWLRDKGYLRTFAYRVRDTTAAAELVELGGES